ncbi:hypothetical protein [Crenothrix sp.]|uniref:hypothetical protein n=1 Tax=Crenothrix sp. TaxID=3100433 RepID=UPI00374CB35F
MPLLALAMLATITFANATEVGQLAPQFTLPTLQQGQPTALRVWCKKYTTALSQPILMN